MKVVLNVANKTKSCKTSFLALLYRVNVCDLLKNNKLK